MAANIGRMSSETREARKRMIAAEEINELSLQDMVQKVYIEEICYIVKSLKTEVVYDISTEQGMMTACNCINFQRNRRVCKSEAGSGTDEALTNISNVCKQALESRIHLTFENNNRLSQILAVNEEIQLPPNINMQTQRRLKKILISKPCIMPFHSNYHF